MDQNQWDNQNEQTEQPASEPQNEFYTQQDSSYNFTPPPVQQPNGYATAALILGIISVVLCSCSCISIVTAVLAIVFAVLSRKGQPMQGKALGGMICGIVALVMVVLSIAALVFMYAETNSEDMMEFYEQFYGDMYTEDTGIDGSDDIYDYLPR